MQRQLSLTGALPDASGAVFSPCRTWRYVLWRRWADGRMAAFIGLNPSTADEQEDDATIRRCIGFARRWQCSGFYMLNLFAYVATYPRDLRLAADPIGPENDAALELYAGLADPLVAAWGGDGHELQRTRQVLSRLQAADVPLHCLGRTKDGAPRHPSRLAYAAELERYR